MAAGTPTKTSSASPLTQWVGEGVLAGKECRVERGDVGGDGDEVVGHVRVEDPAVAVVEFGRLEQCHSDSAAAFLRRVPVSAANLDQLKSGLGFCSRNWDYIARCSFSRSVTYLTAADLGS